MSIITLNPVQSSNVAAVGYDPVSQTLAVKFKGGKTYHYAEVPQAVHHELQEAESVGRFIGARVVGKFQHSTVADKS